MEEYNPQEIEEKWIERWKQEELSKAEVKEIDEEKPKYFVHFAYPNVTGFMHIGHMRGYSYTDYIARKKRMEGHQVFFPGGTHASGNNLISISQKVRNGEKTQYLKDHGVTKEEIDEYKEPEKALEKFNESYKKTWKRYGLTIDLESWTSTTYPEYNKFIEWQFKKLKEKGYLKQGDYYGPACPEHGPIAVDESETDIDKGGNAEKQEYTVLKFKLKNQDTYLTAATLRPETVFGQTNLFIDPETEYLKAEVDGESWIISEPAAEKLEFQGKTVKQKERIKGKELIGKKAKAPKINKEIPILPSQFCDPDEGTGIVTSVPSDAPVDWMGIKELKENPEKLEKYGADPKILKEVEPIPIIDSEGYGEYPAKEVCEEMNIKTATDPKIEQATQQVYKKGFHSGQMNENCGKYARMNVETAKEKVKQELIQENKADILYDLSEEVVCRCGKEVMIKKISGQWFINYNAKNLTQRAKEYSEQMDIKPEEYHKNIKGALEWFGERPATRQGNWLGTKLPWDKKWIIEPISDSTLYPAFYVISKFVNKGEIDSENLEPEFFNYVFLEEIPVEKASEATGLEEQKLKEIRKAFDYWYPDDLNEGGKEHKTVHFPPFIMNHIALLPEKYWPKAILVNWWLTGEGGKLSKSKGGARISAQKVAKKYGADTMRLFYGHASTPFTDIKFTAEKGENYKKNLEKYWKIIHELIQTKGKEKETHIDKWIKSRFNKKLKEAEKAFEKKDFRNAIDNLLFDFMKDIERYGKREGNNPKTTREIASKWIRAMAPYTPFICEELWSKLNKEKLVSRSSYPEVREEQINQETEILEETIKQLEKDIENVMELADIDQPQKIEIFIAPEWKRKAYKIALQTEGNIVKEIMKEPEIKKNGEKAAKYGQYLQKNRHELQETVPTQEKEQKTIKQSKKYLKNQFNTNIEIKRAEESDEDKSDKAMPMKPAILIE